jgi:hypothetical protein
MVLLNVKFERCTICKKKMKEKELKQINTEGVACKKCKKAICIKCMIRCETCQRQTLCKKCVQDTKCC